MEGKYFVFPVLCTVKSLTHECATVFELRLSLGQMWQLCPKHHLVSPARTCSCAPTHVYSEVQQVFDSQNVASSTFKRMKPVIFIIGTRQLRETEYNINLGNCIVKCSRIFENGCKSIYKLSEASFNTVLVGNIRG